MQNYIVFGQNDRLTIRAESYRRVVAQPTIPSSGDGFSQPYSPYAGVSQPPYYEFVNDTGEVVAMLSEFTYSNVVREDALQENR